MKILANCLLYFIVEYGKARITSLYVVDSVRRNLSHTFLIKKSKYKSVFLFYEFVTSSCDSVLLSWILDNFLINRSS